jgi:putative N-acetyltransferase (TIGR04045 family)
VILDPPSTPKCRHLHFRFAREPWERQGYYALRRDIFCEEQGIFEDTDRDEHDADALPIVAVRNCMGVGDEVVGVVRIDERAPGIWWGSRLGVAESYRSLTDFTAHNVFDDEELLRFSSVGATLIYKAVSSAHAFGAQRFFAHVQRQNVSLFRRLHWDSIEEVTLHGRLHHKMEADLSCYPASSLVQERALQPA